MYPFILKRAFFEFFKGIFVIIFLTSVECRAIRIYNIYRAWNSFLEVFNFAFDLKICMLALLKALKRATNNEIYNGLYDFS